MAGKNSDVLGDAKIKGIGPKAVETLASNGVTEVAQLAVMRPEELQAILNVTLAKAKESIGSAKEKALTIAVELKTGQQVADERHAKVKYIPTGSKEFARILSFRGLDGSLAGGGVPTDTITMFTGSAATGKTELCLQLIINCIRDTKRKAAFIETEPSTFSPDRLMEMANAQGAKINLGTDVFVIEANAVTDPFKQFLAYEVVNKKLESGEDIGILCIDSFTAKMRQHFLGRETLTSRTGEMARHLGYLEMMTSKFNLATVLTGQVGGIPDSGAQLGARMRFGMDKSVYGGELMLHDVGNLISLSKAKTEVWMATIADSSYLARTSAFFKITASGVTDLSPDELAAMRK